MNVEELINFVDKKEQEIMSLDKNEKSKVAELAIETFKEIMKFNSNKIYPIYKVEYFEKNRKKSYQELNTTISRILNENENDFIENGFWFVRLYLRTAIISLR